MYPNIYLKKTYCFCPVCPSVCSSISPVALRFEALHALHRKRKPIHFCYLTTSLVFVTIRLVSRTPETILSPSPASCSRCQQAWSRGDQSPIPQCQYSCCRHIAWQRVIVQSILHFPFIILNTFFT